MTAPKPARKSRPGPQLTAVLTSIELASAMATAADQEPSYIHLCLHLLDYPHKIADPAWRHVIIKILRKYAADHPPRTPSSAETAFMVDWWMLLKRTSLAEACRDVAEFTGKTRAAVKKAHTRYGKREA